MKLLLDKLYETNFNTFIYRYETCRFLCEDLTNTIEKKDNLKALELILTAYQKFNIVLADDQHRK